VNSPYTLGVDLGTTWTAAATWRDGRASTASLADHSDAIPSAVFLREDGVVLVGHAAVRRGVLEPERLARGFKRRLGDPAKVLLGDERFTVPELTGHLLHWVVDTVSSREGGPPAHVTLTVPAAWGEHHRELMTAVAANAQLEGVGLLPEPVAVAIHYATQERLEAGSVTSVYDLGGGTFDTALVVRGGVGYELRGLPGGDESIGGEDFDDVVMDHVRRSLGNALTLLDTTDEAVLAGLQQVRLNAVAAKEALSDDLDASVAVILPGITREVRITRAEFESAVRVPLLRTVDTLARTLTSAGLEADDVTAVLLAGGSSRIPLVSQLIAEELGVRVASDAHPKYAVCLGAAIAAAGRLQTAGRSMAPPPPKMTSGGADQRPRTAPDVAALLAPVSGTEVLARPVDLGVGGPVDLPVQPATLVTRPLRQVSDRDELRVVHRSDWHRGWRPALAASSVLLAGVVGVAALAARTDSVADRGTPTSSFTGPSATASTVLPQPPAPRMNLSTEPIPGRHGEVVRAVAAATGGLVAVGDKADGTTGRVWLMTNGRWRSGPHPVAGRGRHVGMNGVAGGQRMPLVAVGWSAAADTEADSVKSRRGEVWVGSADGRRWVRATTPRTGELYDVVRLRNGTLLATGASYAADAADGDGIVLTSTDGSSWRILPAEGLDGPGPFELRRVIVSGGGLVGLGSRLQGADLATGLYTSPNGRVWTFDRPLMGMSGDSAEAWGLTSTPTGDLVVVGEQGEVGGVPTPLVWKEVRGSLKPFTVRPALEGRLLGITHSLSGFALVGARGGPRTPGPGAWHMSE
jgi:actin-like ATPase involved in cell morphogenesis